MTHFLSRTLLLLLLTALLPAQGVAQLAGQTLPGTEEVGLDDKRGDQIPLDLAFTNHKGESVELRDYFASGKPVLLTMVYYDCPMLCHLLLDGVTAGLRGIPQTPGVEYTVLTVSFDASETPAQAAEQRQKHLADLGRPAAANGWHFLTGSEASIQALAQSIGFRYVWDERTEQYMHPAAITFLGADGTINRYLAGLAFAPTDLRIALTETSQGTLGTLFDQFLMFCLMYDPLGHTYTLAVTRLMTTAAILTVFLLGLLVFVLSRRNPTRAPELAF